MDRYRFFRYNYFIPFLIKCINAIFGKRSTDNFSKEFILILGSGRNGSTLLASILNNDKRIFIAPEQYVLPFITAEWQLLRFKSPLKIYNKIKSQLVQPKYSSNWQLDPTDFERLENKIPDSISQLFSLIYKQYSNKVGHTQVNYVGDKSPLNTHYLRLYIDEFEHSKFLFLVRDPRDVIASFKSIEGHKANDLNYAIWKWKDAIIKYDWLNSRKKVLLIKYESLVRNPEEELKRLFKFIGLTDNIELLNKSFDREKVGVFGLSHHQNLVKPINASSIGKWKRILSKQEVEVIKRKLGKMAVKYGYDLN